MFLEVGKDSGDLFGKLVEAVAARVVTVSPGGDDASTWGADCNVYVSPEKSVILSRKFGKVGGDIRDSSTMEIELLVTQIVGGEK